MQITKESGNIVFADVSNTPRMGRPTTVDLIEWETDAKGAYVACDVTDTDELQEAIVTDDRFSEISTL